MAIWCHLRTINVKHCVVEVSRPKGLDFEITMNLGGLLHYASKNVLVRLSITIVLTNIMHVPDLLMRQLIHGPPSEGIGVVHP